MRFLPWPAAWVARAGVPMNCMRIEATIPIPIGGNCVNEASVRGLPDGAKRMGAVLENIAGLWRERSLGFIRIVGSESVLNDDRKFMKRS